MYKRILAAIDLDHGIQEARVLKTAADLSGLYGAHVELLHVVPAAPSIVAQYLEAGFEQQAAESAQQSLQALMDGTDTGSGDYGMTVRFGDVYHEILAHAQESDTDLVIIGSHKPHMADFLLGTNAARVVRHAPCAVFVVR